MLVRVKKSQFTSRLGLFRLRDTQGQALVEYILMLVITVSLVLALISQIFKPFGQFIDNYMGAYVGCLLEYGELPTLGSSDPSAPDEDSECNKRFASASLSSGRPPLHNGQGELEGNKDKSAKGGSGSSSGGYAGSASRNGSRYINSGRGRPSVGVESGAERSGKVVEIALEDGGANAFFRSNAAGTRQSITPRRKTTSVGLAGLSEAEKKKLEKKANSASRVVEIGEGNAPSPKKTMVKMPEAKPVIEEDKPITVGNFIRYLFIAALVIALVIFIGGQALQMSKSFEK